MRPARIDSPWSDRRYPADDPVRRYCLRALAYTIQIFAQAHTPPAEAALILALEGVFAAVAGALLLSERLTAIGTFGCVLIMSGALAAEIGPLFGRKTVRGAT